MNTFAQLTHRAITGAEVMCLAQAKHYAGVIAHAVEFARATNLTDMLDTVDRTTAAVREALIAANQLRECLIQLPEELTEEIMPFQAVLALGDAVSANNWEMTKPAILLVLQRVKPPHLPPEMPAAAEPKAPAAPPPDDFDTAANAADEAEPLPPHRPAERKQP